MTVVRGPRSRPSEPLVVFSAMGAILLVAARFFPFERYPLVTCPLRTWAHIPCLSCGMTRAFVRVTHGQWGSAFRVSPLGALLALTAAGFALYAALRLTVLSRGIEIRLTNREGLAVRIGAVSLLALNWLYLLATGAAG